MKKLILALISIIAALTAFSQSSVYHPFPAGDAYWREGSDGYQCYYCCARYQNILSGDTIINSIIFQKITHSGRQYYSSPAGDCMFSGGYTPFIYYNGAIRNDIPGKKVWLVPADSADEQLLYDFDMQLNDTLLPTFINRVGLYDPDLYNVVSTIDSVLVGDVYHKSFGISLSSSPGSVYTYLIEGVGSTFGLFGSMGELMPPFEFGSMLECLSVDGLSVYPESAEECQLVTEIDEPVNDFKFSILPNPITETARVLISDKIQNPDLIILDLNGRVVLSFTGISDKSVINRKNLPSGMYFYHFSIKGRIMYSGKLIIN